MRNKELYLLLNQYCDEFESCLKAGQRPSLDVMLHEAASSIDDSDFLERLLEELIALTVFYSNNRGQTAARLKQQYPKKQELIDDAIAQPSLLGTIAAKHDDTFFDRDKSSNSLTRRFNSVEEFPRSFGKYQLTKLLGQGGMGRVYLATEQGSEMEVAIKIIRPDMVGDEQRVNELVRRFKTETRTTAAIDHPSIAKIYEVGEYQGKLFYSMKFIDGMTLSQSVNKDEIPDSRRTATIARDIARGIHKAHAAGVFHRDIKPANIMIDRDDHCYVMDFGLASEMEFNSTRQTKTGTLLGTIAYMSPEQATNPSNITATSDVYGVGGVLYFLLTGQPPHGERQSLETLQRLATENVERPSKLNLNVVRQLETICLKCLDRDPSLRYQSADALADDLQRFLDGKRITARPASALVRITKWAAKNRAVASLLLLLFVSVVAGTLIWNTMANRFAQTRTDATIDSLMSAEAAELPSLVDKIANDPNFDAGMLPRAVDGRTKFRVALAKLPITEGVAGELLEMATELNAAQVGALIEVIQRHDLRSEFENWTNVTNSDSANLLVTASVVSGLESHGSFVDANSESIVKRLIGLESNEIDGWLGLLASKREILSAQTLTLWESNLNKPRRSGAIRLLCRFATNKEACLDVLRISDAADLPSTWPTLEQLTETERLTLGHLEDATETTLKAGNLRATRNALLARLHLFDDVGAWKRMADFRNLEIHIGLVEEYVTAGLSVHSLIEKLDSKTTDHDLLFATLLALCEISELDQAEFGGSLEIVNDIFHNHPDIGVHSAAETLLRRWGHTAQAQPVQDVKDSGKDWYEIGEFTMLKIKPAEDIEFTWSNTYATPSGAKDSHMKTLHIAPIAVSSKEVTRQQLSLIENANHDFSIGPSGEHPANNVSFAEAAKFCNLLTLEVGMEKEQCCYTFDDENNVDLVKDFRERRGFRLPLESEWEWVCSSGTMSLYCFGTAEEFWDNYIWSLANSQEVSHPVGRLKPNRFGLFDMFGNVSEAVHREIDLAVSASVLLNQGKYRLESEKGTGFLTQASGMQRNRLNISTQQSSSKLSGFRIVQAIFSH